MRAMAVEFGVPEERIIVEGRAANTFENAVYSGRIIRDRGWRQVVVVTDSFHMPRALYFFRRLGLTVVGEPVRTRAGWSRRRWCKAWFVEVGAFVFSAYLFRIGRHKPVVEAVWGR